MLDRPELCLTVPWLCRPRASGSVDARAPAEVTQHTSPGAVTTTSGTRHSKTLQVITMHKIAIFFFFAIPSHINGRYLRTHAQFLTQFLLLICAEIRGNLAFLTTPKHTNPFHLLYHITAELNMGYSQEFILVKI
jgi:hypothetical protein